MSLSKIIDNLPFELHLPGYRFAGPGTRLKERINQPGINKLDEACKRHDIAYSKSKEPEKRHIADRELAEAAWNIVKSPDATFGEKAAAWAVTTAMKAKVKMGLGLKKNRKTKNCGKKKCGKGMKTKKKKKNGTKRGGILPLLPIFAGLSALGALTGGAAGVAKAVKDGQAKTQELAELKRHNQHMEALASGRGMILKPYKKGGGRKSIKKRRRRKN